MTSSVLQRLCPFICLLFIVLFHYNILKINDSIIFRHFFSGIFSDLLRSVQMLKRVGCGKQRKATAPIQSLVKLQPWFRVYGGRPAFGQNCSLGSCACSEGPALGHKTDDGICKFSFHPLLFFSVCWNNFSSVIWIGLK